MTLESRFGLLVAATVATAATVAVGCGGGDSTDLGLPAGESADAAGDVVSPPPGPASADAGADGGEGLDAAPPPPVDGAAPDASANPSCPALTFPSGAVLQTFPDAKMTAEYASIADNKDYPLPTCFIDTDNLLDPTTGKTETLDVMVGMFFSLREMVQTELPYSHKVLLSPEMIAKLDVYRVNTGGPVTVTSAYRSPGHQRAVCQSICGQDSCGNTCAARSRHSWGDAVDHGVIPSAFYADAACKAKFNYIYREVNHMHLDLNPAHPVCTIDIKN